MLKKSSLFFVAYSQYKKWNGQDILDTQYDYMQAMWFVCHLFCVHFMLVSMESYLENPIISRSTLMKIGHDIWNTQ